MARFSILMCTAAAVLCASAPLCVGTASAESLPEVLAITLESNPQIKSTGHDASMAGFAAQEARSRMLPSVSANYTHQRDVGGNVGSGTVNALGLSGKQLLFNGGSAVKGYKRAKAEARGADERLRQTELEIMQGAAEAYVAASRSAAILSLRSQYLMEVEKQLHIARRRAQEGEGTRTDIDQILSQLYEAQADLADAQAGLEESQARLEEVSGVKVSGFALGPFPSATIPPTLDEKLAVAYSNSALLAEATERHIAAQHGVWADAAAFGPSLYATADVTRQYDKSFENPQSDTKLGLELSIPLTTGGRGYARYQSARALEHKRIEELEAAKRAVVRTVKAASSAFAGANKRLQAAKMAVASATDALKGMSIEFGQGERSISDVITARRELLDRRIDLELAREAQWVAGVAILASLGKLSPGILQQSGPAQAAVIEPVAYQHTSPAKKTMPTAASAKPGVMLAKAAPRKVAKPHKPAAPAPAQAPARQARKSPAKPVPTTPILRASLD